jgi:DNA transformation protein
MSEFTDYLHEVFELAGPITIRRMFGGHSIYYGGLPIGIVYKDTLYLKVDRASRLTFESMGLPQFTYRKKDKVIGLPYYQAPDFILENREEAAIWLKKAYAASLSASKQ